ncbi:MAG: YdiU family protein [Paracoccaceae bacterium]|nr:YdiU family protein [Paracoccaceae bacterium]
MVNFDNSYARLPAHFYAKQTPVPVAKPEFFARNQDLAAEIGLGPIDVDDAAYFGGNKIPQGATPIAQAYSGHQFGGWSPQLGDGRAVLLGEIITPQGERRDVQLKGSGRTPFSRGGDGRAWLGPVMREYLVSEAMHAFGVPTTRALAAVTTGETVVRDIPLPGAILTRVAASHIRVGTFQFFAARGDLDALGLLRDHVMERHYPDASDTVALYKAIIEKQAKLIAKWMSIGFIHGVMNTDNMSISGETIDYGPCAFMDDYQSGKVFSSIDRNGRYAYNRQADMGIWNLAQLGTALLPLMGEDTDAMIEVATATLHEFPDIFQTEWDRLFLRKIGIDNAQDGDKDRVVAFLKILEQTGSDFTNSFAALATDTPETLLPRSSKMTTWLSDWRDRVPDPAAVLQATNPAVIPRNHQIEAAIQAGVQGDFEPFEVLGRVLGTPFKLAETDQEFAIAPNKEQEVTQTFCGT